MTTQATQATSPALVAVDPVAQAPTDGAFTREATVTVAFIDIEGSTAINERVGDRRWLEILREYESIVRDAVGNRGVVAKSMGDGHMLVFGCPINALQCAIALQTELATRESGEPLRVRIGAHTGEALEALGDWHGLNVTVGARIAGEARGGEILVSDQLRELVESSEVARFGTERQVELKGLSGPRTIHPVAIAAQADAACA